MYRDYPEIYYKVYPKIIQTINTHLGSDYSYDNIPKEKMDAMVDDVFGKMVKEYPEIYDDPGERRGRGRTRATQRPFFGRGRITRDLITIILINELLRRNRDERYRNVPYFYPL